MSAASKHDGPVRRSNHVAMPVAYAAVGASNAPDLLRFPPEGSTPFEESLKLGSGQERFLIASSLLMTWGAQRGAGFEVVDIVPGDGGQYAGVSFDPSGVPTPAPDSEDSFGPDGEPYLTAGTRVTLRRGKDRGPRSMLVLYTVDEPRRVGFAWGHVDEEGVVGEQLFTVEHRTDDTVWAVARGFLSVPKGGLLGLKARNLLKTAITDAQDQLTSLAPGSTAGGAASADASGDAGDEDAAGTGAAGTSAEDTGVAEANAAETEDARAQDASSRDADSEPAENAPVTAVIVDLPLAEEPSSAAEEPASQAEESPGDVQEPSAPAEEPAGDAEEPLAPAEDQQHAAGAADAEDQPGENAAPAEATAPDPHRRRPQRPQGR